MYICISYNFPTLKYYRLLRLVLKEDKNFDGLVQERCNSRVLTMELCLSCTNPFISSFHIVIIRAADDCDTGSQGINIHWSEIIHHIGVKLSSGWSNVWPSSNIGSPGLQDKHIPNIIWGLQPFFLTLSFPFQGNKSLQGLFSTETTLS